MGPMENIMDIVHITNKGKMLHTLAIIGYHNYKLLLCF